MNQKKEYLAPEFEITLFTIKTDICTTSNGEGIGEGDEGFEF